MCFDKYHQVLIIAGGRTPATPDAESIYSQLYEIDLESGTWQCLRPGEEQTQDETENISKNNSNNDNNSNMAIMQVKEKGTNSIEDSHQTLPHDLVPWQSRGGHGMVFHEALRSCYLFGGERR